MKKIILFVLAALFIFAAGCSTETDIFINTEQKTEYADVWTAEFYHRSTEKFTLADEEQQFFCKLTDGDWMEELHNTEFEVLFRNKNGTEIYYSSSAGILQHYEEFIKDGSPTVTALSIKLSVSEKLELNKILRAYEKPEKSEKSEKSVRLLLNGEDIELAPGGGYGVDAVGNWDGPGPKEALENLLEEKALADSGEYEEGVYVDMLNVVTNNDELELILSREHKATLRKVLVFDENCEEVASFKTLEEIYTLSPGTYYIGLEIYTAGKNSWSVGTDFFTFIVE